MDSLQELVNEGGELSALRKVAEILAARLDENPSDRDMPALVARFSDVYKRISELENLNLEDNKPSPMKDLVDEVEVVRKRKVKRQSAG